MTTQSHPQAGWWFLIKWIVATAISPILALIFSILTVTVLGTTFSFIGLFIGLALSAISIGTLLGFIQKNLLKAYVDDVTRWTFASTIGWIIGSLVAGCGVISFAPLDVNVFRTMIGVAVGLSLGITQWAILKRQFEQAIWLIPANVIGWTIFISNLDAGFALPMLGLTSSISNYVIGGLIIGTITGFTMMWVLRQPIQQIDQSTSSV